MWCSLRKRFTKNKNIDYLRIYIMYFFGLRNYVSSYSFYFILDIVASSYLLSTTVDPSIILVFNSLFNSHFEYLLHPFCTSVHISHLLKVPVRLDKVGYLVKTCILVCKAESFRRSSLCY